MSRCRPILLRIRLLVIFAVASAIVGTSSHAALQIIDQQNPGTPSMFVVSAGGIGSGVGQSFTPALATMDAADFYVQPREALTLVLDLRSGVGFTGSLLATSQPISLTSPVTQLVEFSFSSPVTLVPESIYSFRIRITAGGASGYLAGERVGSSYARGNELSNDGSSNGGFDLIFAEGVAGVPEPSTWAMLAAGAGLLGVGVLRRRQRAGGLMGRKWVLTW